MENKQYLIEIAVGDSKLSSSLKKALTDPSVQKQLGILGEGITEHLEKDVSKAASILGKVDWASLLGQKDFEHLQQLVAQTIRANKDLVNSFIKKGDMQGIADTIKLVSELGAELRAIDPEFTVKGLARSMASFIKVVEPLSGKLNEISSGAQNFQSILNNFDTSTINNQIKEISQSAQGMIDALNKKASLNALEQGIKEVGGEAVKLQDVMLNSDAMDAYLSKFKTAKDITKEMSRLMSEASRGVHKDPTDRVIFKQYLEGLQGKLASMMPTLDGSAVAKEAKVISKDIDAVVEQITDKLEKSFNKTIEEKLGSIRVKVDVPTEDALIADLNAVIEKVNVKGTNSLKLVGAESAINAAQNQILENTKKWHDRMKDFLKFDKKEDIKLDLGAMMREMGSNVGDDFKRSIEEYFDDPNNRVSVPVELVLTDKNKAVLDGSNITIAGGTVSGGAGLTAESLMKMLTTPIEVKVPEEQQEKNKPDGKLISIDRDSPFAQEIIGVFEKLIEAAGRDGQNAKTIGSFFTGKLSKSRPGEYGYVDLASLGKISDSSERNNAIIDAFETLLEDGDKSLLDDVDSHLAKGSTKNVATTAFRDLLRDSVFRFDLEQISTKEDVKRRQVRDLVLENYIPKSLNQELLSRIRRTDAKDYKLPTVEELDKLMQELPQTWGKLGEAFVPALEELKKLRSSITDPTNASEIKRFQEEADEFASTTAPLYREMQDFMKGYKIGVFNKGHNKHNKMYDRLYRGGVGSGSKILQYLANIDYFELYDDPSGHFSRGNRKDAMDNAGSLDRYQLRRDASSAPYRTREPKPTNVSVEDIEIPKFEPQQKEEKQEINEYKVAAEQRAKALEETRKAIIEEAKAAEELRKQQLETDKKKRTALKGQKTKNENKLKNALSEEETLTLQAKNTQLTQEIAELDKRIAKNSIEPTKTLTAKQQLDNYTKDSEIPKLREEIGTLDKKIETTQQETENIEKFVEKHFRAVKKPNIDYTKGEANNQKKQKEQAKRLDALSGYLTDKNATSFTSTDGMTEKDTSIVSNLLSDRKIYQIINSGDGLALPQNSNLESVARARIQAYSDNLKKIDDFILKHNISIKSTSSNSELTEFMKDDNVRYVMAGTFKGSQEDEAAIKTKINEFKSRMIEAGKSYVADYIDMWSDSSLRKLMNDNATRTKTDAQSDSILQEFYRRIVEGGVSKRGEAYRYLKDESAKYQKNIAKDEGAVAKLVDNAGKQIETTSGKDVIANERIKEEYKKYMAQWLQTIQTNMTDIASSEIGSAEKALKVKKNDELRGLISDFARKYFNKFGEKLLTENQTGLLGTLETDYKTFLKDNEDKNLEQAIAERQQKQQSIDEIISEKSKLLEQRRVDLLNRISSNISKGKDTKSLETTLTEVENELVQYSNVPTILKEQFEADLLNTKNATDEAWKQFGDKVQKRKDGEEVEKYKSLKDQQKSLLSEISAKTQTGESTGDLEKQLEALNKELVKYAVNAYRMEDIKKSMLPDDASTRAIRVYNTEMTTLVKLLQEKAMLEALGKTTLETDSKIAKQKKRVVDETRRQIEADKKLAASYDPKNQASKFIADTDADFGRLGEEKTQAERNLGGAQTKLSTILGDGYAHSRIYTDRIESLKTQEVASYVRSDEYKAARQRAVEQADAEFADYLVQHFDKDVSANIVYEFSNELNRGDRADISSMVTPKLKEIFEQRAQLLKEISEADDDAIKQGLRDRLELLRQEANKEFKAGNIGGAGIGQRLVVNAFSETMAKERQKYTDGDVYQQLVAQKKADIEREIAEELKSEKEATETKVQEIKNASKLRKKQIRKATLESLEELRAAVDAQAQADGMGDSADYKRSIVDRVKEDMLQQIFEETGDAIREQWRPYNTKIATKRSERYPAMYQELNEKADKVVYNVVMSKIRVMLGQNAKVIEGLDGRRDGLVKKYTENIVAQYRDGLRMEETGIYQPRGTNKPINIREQLKKELEHEVAFYYQKYVEASGKYTAFEHERSKAKSFGELGYDEELNPEIVRVRAEAEARLTTEKERQVNLTEKLTTLTAQNADQKVVQSVAAELSATEKEISRLQMLAEGASEALSIRKIEREEELEEKKITPERQRLWFIDHIEEAKKVLEGGTDKEKETATNNIARWEQKLANVEKIIEASKPEAEKPRTILDMITHAIRDGLAGVTTGGTVNLDASLYNIATETTLQEILRLLGGNGAVEYANQLKKELEKYRPRYERKEQDGGNSNSQNNTSNGRKSRVNTDLDKLNDDGKRIYGELEAQAKLFTGKLKEKNKQYASNFDFVKAIKDQAAVVKKQTKGSLEYVQEQTRLTLLYQDYYKKMFGAGRRKNGQPTQSQWTEQGELGKVAGLKDLLLFKGNRADALASLGYGVKGAVKSDELVVENKPKKTNKKKNTKATETAAETTNTELQQIITDAVKVAKDGQDNIDSNTLISKVLGPILQTLGLDPNDEDIAKAVGEIVNKDGLGRDRDVKAKVKEGVKEGVVEGAKTTPTDKKLPYSVDPNSLIGKLQNTVGGDTNALAKQATLALVLSELQAINKKVPTIGKTGVKSSAQNLLEEFQKMAMGSAMDSKERVSNVDLVNGTMSPALSGAAHSISQKLLDTLSEQYGVGQGYRSQVHTHADSDQTWFSAKDLDHFKKNIGEFGADSIKQQVLLTKDNITVFDMTMVETAEKAALAIEILKKAGSNINNETLEKLGDLGARYQSKNLGAISAKGLMDMLGVKNYKNDGKTQKNSLTEDDVEKRRVEYERFVKAQAATKNSQYAIKSFDGETMKYQLVNTQGEISKVIIAWDELQNKVRVVSDTSTSSIDTTVNKIRQYKNEVASAQKERLLSEGDDAAFVAAEKAVDKIVAKIEGRKSTGKQEEDQKILSALLDKLEVARQNLADEGEKLHKLIAKNEKLRGGTTEIKQVITQGTRVRSLIDSIGVEEKGGLQLFSVDDDAPKYLNDYILAYNTLIEKQQEYIKDGSINSAKVQDNLKVQTASVKKLGIEAMAVYKKTQELQEKSDLSKQQTYTNAHGKEYHLGDDRYVGGQMPDRAAMLQYAKEVLGADLASVKLNTTTGKLTGVLRKNNYVVADMAIEYDKATGKMHLYQEKERESLSGMPGFMHGLKQKSKAIIQYVASMTSIYRVLGEIRKGIQYVRDIDLALTELKKVTDGTEETYDKFLDTAAKTGARLGTTISAVTEATATFAKLGYTMEQATEMAEAAIVYKNVGDNIASTEDAADSIISTMKGFGLEASESMAIVDKFNEVGNRFAITSQGIGEALRLSASALNEGKNSLDEAIAMITAANEVVNDPSSVGK